MRDLEIRPSGDHRLSISRAQCCSIEEPPNRFEGHAFHAAATSTTSTAVGARTYLRRRTRCPAAAPSGSSPVFICADLPSGSVDNSIRYCHARAAAERSAALAERLRLGVRAPHPRAAAHRGGAAADLPLAPRDHRHHGRASPRLAPHLRHRFGRGRRGFGGDGGPVGPRPRRNHRPLRPCCPHPRRGRVRCCPPPPTRQHLNRRRSQHPISCCGRGGTASATAAGGTRRRTGRPGRSWTAGPTRRPGPTNPSAPGWCWRPRRCRC